MEAGQGKANQPAARRPSGVARFAALAAVLAAATLAGLLLFGGGDGYTVKARFLNAGQLVKGNLVDVGGTEAGLVTDFEHHRRRPGRGRRSRSTRSTRRCAAGTRAVIRQARPASVGQPLRAADAARASTRPASDIHDGGRDRHRPTTTDVDLDQFFNIFDQPTRKALQDFYKGGQRQYAGRGEAGQPRPALPEPAARRVEPPVRGAAPRPAGAGALPGRLARAS